MTRQDSGVAFILVLTVLLGLLVLAAPFLTVALNDHAVSETVISEGQVEAGTSAMLRYGAWWLERTTDAAELRKGGDPSVDPFSTPDWDTEEEFAVPIDLAGDRGALLLGGEGVPLMGRRDARGETWDLRVREEQSIPNLWSSPPYLTSASFGRTVTTINLKPDETVVELEDGTGFPEKGGAVWIDGERITYERREGNTLLNCARGAPGGGRGRSHKAEIYVLDDRAREIAMLPFMSPRAKGGWREPLDVAAAKEITLFGDGVLSPLEVDRLAREFTVTSWRITGEPFGPAQTLRQPIDPATADTSDGFKIRVKSNDGINAGTLVRITDGVNTEYAFVVASSRRGNNAVLTLADKTKYPYTERRTAVAPLIRHPVNVNTASRETLKRIVTGLQVTGGRRDPPKIGRVTTLAAEIVANQLIANRPIKDLEQLREVLQKTSEASVSLFDQSMMIAVFRNAVDAGDWTLGNSTVPFCFKSYDYFTLTASATVSDKAGSERARREVKESVRVAPPGRLVHRLDTQADFEDAIVRARNSFYSTTHPNPVERVNPMAENEIPASRIPRMLLNPKDDAVRKVVFPHRSEGDMRLWPARMEGLGGFIEHFDGQAFGIPDNVEVTRIDPEGWILENGAYQLPLADSGQNSSNNRAGGGRGGQGGGRRGRGGRGGGGSILGRTGANGIKIDMWYRPDGAGGGHTFYDLVGSDPEQRIKLSLEANGDVRAYVRDRTIDKPDDFEEACMTVFRPPPGLWGARNWYHVGMSYRGCKPEEVSLWWDGMKRGEARYQSILAGSVSDTDTSFSIERADDWPQRGVCWVGREAVEFERSGTTLTAVTYPTGGGNGRGKRGTPAIPHAAGEVVQLFGYSNLVESQTKRGGIAIPRGGGNLASDLGPWNIASFAGNHEVIIPPSQPGGPTIKWEVLDPSKPFGNELKLVLPSNSPLEYVDSFQTSGGYIMILGCLPMTAVPAGPPPWQAELAYYASFDRGTRTLTGIQPVPTPPNPDLAGQGGAGVIPIYTTRQLQYLRAKEPPGPYWCAVFPISVGITNTSGYLTPKAAQGQTQVDPEYISLGEPDYDNVQQHKIEWISYYHLDTSKNALLCDDLNLLNLTLAMITQVLAPPPNQTPPSIESIGRDMLGMRSQHRTDMFKYGALSAGGAAQVHATSEDVTPVFRVVQYPGVGFSPPTQPNQQPSPIPGNPAPGWGDSVTLETANATVRKRFDVTWSNDEHVSVGESPGQDFSQRAIAHGIEEPREQYLRLLKFPSGELPRIQRPAKGRAGGDTEGTVSAGRLDEVRVAPFQSDRFIVWDHSAMGLNASQATANAVVKIEGISESANEIPISNTHWYMKGLPNLPGTNPGSGSSNAPYQVILPDGRGVEYEAALNGLPNNDAGLVQIDDEIIAFRRIGQKGSAPALLDCERGVFNTTPQKHGYGANVIFLDFLPVTMLSEALSPTASLVNIASEQGFPTTGGLVLVDRELIHFTEISGRSFAMPPILDKEGEEQGGLFRGRFGTTAARHDAEAIVIEMPFRYWDRFGESQDNPEISFYQFALNRPGAWFDRFGYEEYRQSPNVQIVTLVRTEQDVPWCTDPTRASPKLLRFESGLGQDKGLHAVGRHGTALEARFYVRYLGNSFDPITLSVHDWKTTPELRWAEVHYFDETQVLERESGR